MIGIVILADLKDQKWEWKLLHKFSGTTPLQLLTSELAKVEHSHRNIVSFTHAERPLITGSVFNDPVWTTSHITHFSVRKTYIGRVHDACIANNLDGAVIVNAEDWLTPAYIVKDLIMMSEGCKYPAKTSGFPSGIGAAVMPFHEIANMYRFEGLPEEEANMARLASITRELPNEYIKTKLDLKLSDKSQIPLFDMIVKDLQISDLAEVLEDINELQ